MGFKPILRRAGLITDDWLFSRCSLRSLWQNPVSSASSAFSAVWKSVASELIKDD